MESSVFVHEFDPFLINSEWFALPWYWLIYLLGFFGVWQLSRNLCRQGLSQLPVADLRFYLVFGWFGLLLAARLVYVLVYNFEYYRTDLLGILAIWEGGMSFHGGLIGIVLSTFTIAWYRKQSPWQFLDLLACTAPFALGLGRIANFINGELVGRVTSVPWAVIFPQFDMAPRHPSQLYQAVGEGLVLGFIMWKGRYLLAQPAQLSGLFLLCYGMLRFLAEFWREPDPQLGFVALGLSMGQIFSLLMITGGTLILAQIRNRFK